MRCNICSGCGWVNIYLSGRVQRAYCHCAKGLQREKERDDLCRSLGTSVEFDKKFRVRYEQGAKR